MNQSLLRADERLKDLFIALSLIAENRKEDKEKSYLKKFQESSRNGSKIIVWPRIRGNKQIDNTPNHRVSDLRYRIHSVSI